MTDRIHILTVALEQPVRDDDVQTLVSAISQMRGVAGVKLNVANQEAYAAAMRLRHRMEASLLGHIRDFFASAGND